MPRPRDCASLRLGGRVMRSAYALPCTGGTTASHRSWVHAKPVPEARLVEGNSLLEPARPEHGGARPSHLELTHPTAVVDGAAHKIDDGTDEHGGAPLRRLAA